MKRIALVFAVVTMLAMVLAPVASADENEAGWWGNIVGYPDDGNPICLTATDGSMVNNFILYSKVPLLIVQDLPSKEEPDLGDRSTREKAEH